MKIYELEIGAIGQARWYIPFQHVIVKIECLQSGQIFDFLWNFTIEAGILEIDGPKKAKVANVR